jgi:NADPH:quinone reductase-like Zn-dependent oxidoreductase
LKSVEIKSFGIDHLEITEKEIPRPKRGEVLVHIRAVSLNYRDFLTIEGKYNPNYKLPLIPCSDAAGEVVELGEDVGEWKIGDQVLGVFASDWVSGTASLKSIRKTLGGPLEGTLQEYRIFPEDGLVSMPPHLSFVQGSTLPCAALTAWSSLTEFGNTKPGSTIVTQGTGGVSLFAIQLGKLFGAKIFSTTGSEEKDEKLYQMGAFHVIHYKKIKNWGKEIKKISQTGVDHVLDVAGGTESLEESIRALKPFGQISLIGILGGSSASINLLPILMQNIRIQGILVGSKSAFVSMNEAISHHQMIPIIDKEFSLTEVKDAFLYLKSGKHFGKICIHLS